MRRAISTTSPEATYTLARQIARSLQAGDCLALVGDLGAGKTQFARGIKDGLAARGEMQSPTFTLLRSYETAIPDRPFHHFDAYRLTGADEWYDLGFDDTLADGGIALIEWADIVAEALPAQTIWLEVTKDDADDNGRHFVFSFPEEEPRADTFF